MRFPTIKVFFNSVETKWVPEAYLYRRLNQPLDPDASSSKFQSQTGATSTSIRFKSVGCSVFFRPQSCRKMGSMIFICASNPRWKYKDFYISFLHHCTRRGKNTYCYGFHDDGPNANTVLGAVWMLHQEGALSEVSQKPTMRIIVFTQT